MPPKRASQETAALNIRNIPRATFFRLKMAAAAEEKSVTEFILTLVQERIQELEKKGLLPKGK